MLKESDEEDNEKIIYKITDAIIQVDAVEGDEDKNIP